MVMNLAVHDWLMQALRSDLTLRCAAIAGGCLVVLIGLTLIMRRASRGARRARSLVGEQSGTAVLEFALVVPIMIFLMLVLAQTTLVMTGNLFVHYSAFAATRSAIVVIPAATSEEPPNYMTPQDGYEKFDAIHTAAATALVPVSGRLRSGSGPASAVVDGLVEHYDSYGRDTPVWVQNLIADRVRYAVANTDVQVLRTVVRNAQEVQLRDKIEDDLPFGPREAISVRVEHGFNLSIPVVWPIFDDDNREPVSTIDALYTLTNEGVEVSLPQPPSERGIPRVDPRDL